MPSIMKAIVGVLNTSFELGLIYALVPMALFISYRVLDIADLTTDGCFVLGGAVSVMLAKPWWTGEGGALSKFMAKTFGVDAGHPWIAIIIAMFAGACAGFVTAFLHTRMKVPSILAGIITNTGLYTINLMVMKWSAGQNLLKEKTVFSVTTKALKTLAKESTGGKAKFYAFLADWYVALFVLVVLAVVTTLLLLFLNTRLGLSIRATGDNLDMVRASSINPTFTITVGLCLANSLTALSGALAAQNMKTVDINSGTGIVVIGLACLIIGETIVGRKPFYKGIFGAIVGSIVYRTIYQIIYQTKIISVDFLKLVTAIIVAVAIAFPSMKKWFGFQKKKMAHNKRKGGN